MNTTEPAPVRPKEALWEDQHPLLEHRNPKPKRNMLEIREGVQIEVAAAPHLQFHPLQGCLMAPDQRHKQTFGGSGSDHTGNALQRGVN